MQPELERLVRPLRIVRHSGVRHGVVATDLLRVLGSKNSHATATPDRSRCMAGVEPRDLLRFRVTAGAHRVAICAGRLAVSRPHAQSGTIERWFLDATSRTLSPTSPRLPSVAPNHTGAHVWALSRSLPDKPAAAPISERLTTCGRVGECRFVLRPANSRTCRGGFVAFARPTLVARA